MGRFIHIDGYDITNTFEYGYDFTSIGLILATDYYTSYYEGFGHALSLTEDGKVELYNLGHCSCYGPLDNGPVLVWNTYEEFLNDDNVLHQDYNIKIKDTFIEVVNGYYNKNNG